MKCYEMLLFIKISVFCSCQAMMWLMPSYLQRTHAVEPVSNLFMRSHWLDFENYSFRYLIFVLGVKLMVNQPLTHNAVQVAQMADVFFYSKRICDRFLVSKLFLHFSRRICMRGSESHFLRRFLLGAPNYKSVFNLFVVIVSFKFNFVLSNVLPLIVFLVAFIWFKRKKKLWSNLVPNNNF